MGARRGRRRKRKVTCWSPDTIRHFSKAFLFINWCQFITLALEEETGPRLDTVAKRTGRQHRHCLLLSCPLEAPRSWGFAPDPDTALLTYPLGPTLRRPLPASGPQFPHLQCGVIWRSSACRNRCLPYWDAGDGRDGCSQRAPGASHSSLSLLPSLQISGDPDLCPDPH